MAGKIRSQGAMEPTIMTSKYSYDALMQFMDWVIEKRLLNKQTASSRKTAAQKVLDVLDGAEREDLREVDQEAVFARFQNINRSKYTPDSLKVYRSRFASALEAFLSHADDPDPHPSSFKAVVGPKKGGSTGPRPKAASGRKTPPPATPPTSQAASPSESAADGHLTLPIPLRPGLLVKVFGLPTDLNEDEAKKICAVISAYIAHK